MATTTALERTTPLNPCTCIVGSYTIFAESGPSDLCSA